MSAQLTEQVMGLVEAGACDRPSALLFLTWAAGRKRVTLEAGPPFIIRWPLVSVGQHGVREGRGATLGEALADARRTRVGPKP